MSTATETPDPVLGVLRDIPGLLPEAPAQLAAVFGRDYENLSAPAVAILVKTRLADPDYRKFFASDAPPAAPERVAAPAERLPLAAQMKANIAARRGAAIGL